MAERKKPLISIVITSYTMSRFKDVCELLDSIKGQSYSNLEVIFVAERSKELLEKVKEYGEKIGLQNFRVLWNDGEPGASASRNLGIKNAKGEIIAFTDDDVVLFPNWAEKMIETYNDDSIIGVTGPAYPLWEDPSMAWLPEELHWLISCTSWFNCNEVKGVRNVWLQNASFRREAFDEGRLLNVQLGPQDSVKSFKGRELKEGIISEEVEFSLVVREKTKKCIVYNPNVKVKHKVPKERLKLSYIIRWSYWMGLSKYKLKELFPQINRGENLLNQEYQLLHDIFFKLIPAVLKTFLKKPAIAWRKLSVTFIVLFFVTLGYCFHQ